MKKKLMLILAILFTATSIFAMKIYLTNSAGSGQAQADPNASLGGYRSTTELSATSMKNLFDDVSIVEALLGDTEYRMIDIYNDAATDALRVQFYTRTPTSSPDTALTYGYSATNQPHADSWNGEALANESTAPASPSMSFVDSTKTSPLAFGTIPAGSSARVCVKRVVSAGSAWTAHDIGSFGVRWGVAAPASPCPSGTYTFAVNFDYTADTDSGCYGTTETAGTVTGATIGTDSGRTGNGCLLNAVTENVVYTISEDATKGTIWLSARINILVTNTGWLVTLSDGTLIMQIQVANNGVVKGRYGDQFTANSATSVVAGTTWYRIGFSWDNTGTDKHTIVVNASDPGAGHYWDGEASQTETLQLFGTLTTFVVGNSAYSMNRSTDIDDVYFINGSFKADDPKP